MNNQAIMKKLLYIILLIFIASDVSSQKYEIAIHQKLNELGLETSKSQTNEYANQLINTWRKLGHEENKYNPYIVLPIKEWEKLFEKEYQNVADTNIKTRIAIHYSTILIDLSKYEKALTILKLAYPDRTNISKNEYKILLSNLEICYKSKNEITKAIEIRNELIANKLINNYWRIYKACGLGEAAIEDFTLFEEKKYFNGNEKIIHPSYYNNLCRLYFSNNKIDSAVKYGELGLLNVNKALEEESIQFIHKKEILNNWKALYYGFLGKCDMTKKDYPNAIIKLKYAIVNGKIDIESNTLSMIYLSLCYMHLNELGIYKIYSDSVKNIIKTIDAEDVIRSYYSASHQYYAKIKKYDSAFYYLSLYAQYREKMSKGVQQNQSILLLGQLEIEKRRLELNTSKLNLGKSEITIKKINSKNFSLTFILIIVLILTSALLYILYQNKKNRNLLRDKNRLLNYVLDINKSHIIKNESLLKELHHRVKNNLQLMYSLLNLQKRRNENIGIVNNLTTVQNRIHTMSLVHEYLYNSNEFEFININEYIQTLVSHLQNIYNKEKPIEIVYKIDSSIDIKLEKIVYLGLMLNEIVSNAFKYAFEEKGGNQLLIKIDNNISSIMVIISDNGPGLDISKKKINSLGHKLIDVMCLQLNGTHQIKNDAGLTHIIQFNI